MHLKSPTILRVAPALLAMLTSGCLFGPNYKRPKVDMPEAWSDAKTPQGVPATQSSAARQAAAADVSRWWTTLHDPTLDSLIDRAVQSNLDLRQAAARIRQARAQRGVTESGLFPTVDASGRYSRTASGPGEDARSSSVLTLPDGTPVVRQGTSGSTRRNLFTDGLDAAWELDVFGGIRRGVEAADADTQFAIEDYRNVLVTLLSEVALNYVDLRQFQRQLDIANQNLAAQEQTAKVTRQRQLGGEASGLDVANAEAQVASTRSQIPSIKTQVRQAIHRIGVLLAQTPDAMSVELEKPAGLPTPPAEVPIGLPSELLLRRPDIRQAEARAHAATARIGVATADLFPRFTLTGSLGLQGDQLGSLSKRDNYFWSFGPSISWPLFDAGRIRSNIHVQEAVQEEALLAYRATILTALQEVEDSLVAFSNEQERRQSLIKSVEANRKAVELSTALYSRGLVEFLNVLNAQRSLFSSEDALAQSDRTVITNLIAIYKALGGGWEAPASTQPAP